MTTILIVLTFAGIAGVGSMLLGFCAPCRETYDWIMRDSHAGREL